jgi:SAM-dependent methyltransferase
VSPAVFEAFEAMLRERERFGPVLELGATRDPDTLLQLPCLRGMRDKIGVNVADLPGGEPPILRRNANDLGIFADGHFGVVMCNSMLEHDMYFWKTLEEARRVTAPGGLIAIGVPGYAGMGMDTWFTSGERLPRLLRWLIPRERRAVLDASALTLGEHHYPDDFYRFSREAVRQVFMAGLQNVVVRETMRPLRFIGVGTKP